MTMIYHITTRRAWSNALRLGEYRAESLKSEGFIHCSTSSQVLPVAETLFGGGGRLFLLQIDPSLLASELKWEAPAGKLPRGVPEGDFFPHIYGPINLDAVVRVFDLEANPDDKYTLPQLD